MHSAGLGLLAFSITALFASPAVATPRPARCDIGNNYGEHFKGPRLFTVNRDGSFSVSRPRGAAITGDVVQVTVQIVGRGAAEVRGLTRAGINSRWGSASRSPSDRACWLGSDFWVCAY